MYNAPKPSVFTTSSQQAAALGLSTGAKDGEAPSARKAKGKIHPAGIRGSFWAELRQSHHRNRKTGEREAVASRLHWLLAGFGSCLGSGRGRFASL